MFPEAAKPELRVIGIQKFLGRLETAFFPHHSSKGSRVVASVSGLSSPFIKAVHNFIESIGEVDPVFRTGG